METLPLDILIYIIELLAGGDDNLEDIKFLSQTCKSMVPLCYKHIFSTLYLHNKLVSKRFSDLLSMNPDIAHYVTRLSYKVSNPISDHELNNLDMLKEHSSLQLIELSSSGLDWNNLNESIRLSLVFLIQMPTVTFLSISSFKGFPATALFGCSNIIDLQLGDLSWAPPKINQVISRIKIPTPVSLYIKTKTYGLAALLNSASLRAGDPIIDFSRLEGAIFCVESRNDLVQANEVIKVTTRLVYLNIFEYRHVELAGLGTSLAINAYRTLVYLELSITVGDVYDPLRGLSRELRIIAENNILEELELCVAIEDDGSLDESKDCSAFDSVLTGSGAFPMLHRVSVDIYWCSQCMDTSYLDAMVDSLKKDKFPRLVESQAVKFDFCAHTGWCW